MAFFLKFSFIERSFQFHSSIHRLTPVNSLQKEKQVSLISIKSRKRISNVSLPYGTYRLNDFTGASKKRELDFCVCYRFSRYNDWFDESDGDINFDQAVDLFNSRNYYKCHDFLEYLWNRAEEPKRTLIHGILQCAVGFHHLLNKNHRGAMMEFGEGLCKIRKLNFESGPFHRFEQGISSVLEFLYQTQMEFAACNEELCLTMDGSERSYQLLGTFAAGQQLYKLETDSDDNTFIIFQIEGSYSLGSPTKIRVPTLDATQQHLNECDYG